MRSYSISSADSFYPSPISSRATSPHPHDAQATPRVSTGMLPPMPPQHSAFMMPKPGPAVGRETIAFVAHPQHWDPALAQQSAAPAPAPPPDMQSAPGDMAHLFTHPASLPYSQTRPGLFTHHTTGSGVGKVRRGGARDPYPRMTTTQFVHLSPSVLSGPMPKLRTQQACETCRRRKAKCSGDRPSCRRCLERGIDCDYAMIDERARAASRRAKITAARMERRANSSNGGVDGFLNVNGQMYLAVDQIPTRGRPRTRPRPELVNGQDESQDMDDDEDGEEETELVVVELPRGQKRRTLLDLLNPVSVHPMSMFKQRSGGEGSTMAMGKQPMMAPIEFPATNPTMAPPSALPVMMDPTLSSSGPSASASACAEATANSPEAPSRKAGHGRISIASLVTSTSSTPDRSHTSHTSHTSTTTPSSIGTGLAASAIDDLSMGWLESAHSSFMSFPTMYAPSAGNVRVGNPAATIADVASLQPTMAMYRSASSTSSSTSEYEEEACGTHPMSRTSSASSTSAEPGTPVMALTPQWLGDGGADDELQGLFERAAISSEAVCVEGEGLGVEGGLGGGSVPTSPVCVAPPYETESGGGDGALPVVGRTRSAPGTAAETLSVGVKPSLIPRAVLSQVTAPPPPTRSSVSGPSGSSGSTPQAPVQPQDTTAAFSPEFSFGSFASGSGDQSAFLDTSLLDEMFNFDEFVIPEDFDLNVGIMGVPSSTAAGNEDADGPVQRSAVCREQNAPSPSSSPVLMATDAPSPAAMESVPSSTSRTSTLGDHSKSIMEEVLSFVASTSSQGVLAGLCSPSLASQGALAASGSGSGLTGSGSCAAELNGAGNGAGAGGLEVSGSGSGSMGDVVMTSPVMVL
ncbi:hypothetical protein EIP91_000859 [Steccherinum ochraceum]|uniref:Zn(2)-C6 fungal-type domain-containing protein n=1 Tax=Steccherinum ochraceum TaxID=92696 RepID=A0A4R0RU04_9APHY|nr:hypothetical protein EIP91_000859 [Steccherinum ochraceum]